MSDKVYDRLVTDALEKNKTITVTFFRHNQKLDRGKTYIWNMNHQFKTFEQMRLLLANDVHGPTGPSQRVYDLEGNKITKLEELKHGGKYICCGGEAFTTAGIPPAAREGSGASAPAAAPAAAPAQASSSAEQGEEGRVIDQEELKQMIDRDIQQQKTKVCFFYGAAGQARKTDKAARIIINPNRYRNIDQLIAEVRGKVFLVTGVIQVLYDLEGNAVKGVEDLVDKGKYICSILKPFTTAMIPPQANNPVE